MGKSVELHFQEGFTGHVVRVTVDGEVHSSSELKTRPQLGLAKIETLEVEGGQSVTIDIPDLKVRQTHVVAESDQWISVNLMGRSLAVEAEGRSPGYV